MFPCGAVVGCVGFSDDEKGVNRLNLYEPGGLQNPEVNKYCEWFQEQVHNVVQAVQAQRARYVRWPRVQDKEAWEQSGINNQREDCRLGQQGGGPRGLSNKISRNSKTQTCEALRGLKWKFNGTVGWISS